MRIAVVEQLTCSPCRGRRADRARERSRGHSWPPPVTRQAARSSSIVDLGISGACIRYRTRQRVELFAEPVDYVVGWAERRR